MHILPSNDAAVFNDKKKGTPPIVLTIAGFDPSSGAGITADLKVFAAHGLFGMSCITALTVQSTSGVRRTVAVADALVEETLACLAEDSPIAGVKIGMLADAQVVGAVAQWLSGYRKLSPNAPVVLDPVLRSSSGAELLSTPAAALLVRELLPLVSVLTPNLEEAAFLAGAESSRSSREAVPAMADTLLRKMHPRGAVIVTGGHLDGGRTPDDYLLGPGAGAGEWIRGSWVRTDSTHGTGCAFSSALLCRLVDGCSVRDATQRAKVYVQAALAAAYPVGRGRGPMHHLYAADAILARNAETGKDFEPSE